MNKKILIITEGEIEEPRILDAKGKGILNLISNNFEIVSLQTSIYELYDVCKQEGYDTVSYLVSIGKLILDNDELPKTAFSAVYLIFDFEPHYQKYSDEKIIDMLNIFNDETELGKLYINYPMVESYYHLLQIPDYDYLSRTIKLDEFKGKHYKEKVYSESAINHKPLPKRIINSVMQHNFVKAEKICNADFKEYIDHKQILETELSIKNNKNELYVLNTLSLLPIDYNPSLFIKLINSKIK